MLEKQLTVGRAFGTLITIHTSWLWLIPFAIFSLVYLEIEPLIEAIVTSLLLFGSVLLAAIARLWAAKNQGLQWHKMTLFLVGGSIQRNARSTPSQEALIETAGLGVNLSLAILFGSLWFALPTGALGIEMEMVALFNVALVLFSFLLRLSPNHDNLLHALLAVLTDRTWAHNLMVLLHSILLMLFAISSILALSFGVLSFGWWFALAFMLSELTTTAEQQGEYWHELPLSQSLTSAESNTNVRQKAQI